MHVSVPFFLDEGRMVREIVFLRMFQNEVAAGEENIPGKNLVRQGGEALEIFKDFPVPTLGYEEITKKWQPKEKVREQLTALKENWPDFKRRLQNQVMPFAQVKEMFGRAGAPTEPEQIGLTRADVRKMTDFVQLMRWRINILDLAKRACIYDELLDKVFGKGGVWEI